MQNGAYGLHSFSPASKIILLKLRFLILDFVTRPFLATMQTDQDKWQSKPKQTFDEKEPHGSEYD